MKKRKMIAMLLAGVFAFTLGLTGCSSSGTSSKSSATTAGNAQVLNLALTSDAATLDSVKGSDDSTLMTVNDTQEGLTRYEDNGKTTVIKPAGAIKWEISPNGLVYTFHLRDYNWSDGKEVTAQDYVYAWTRLLDPQTAAAYASFLYCIKGAEEYNAGKGELKDVGIKAIDSKTLQITLKSPLPYFVSLTGFRALVPQRKDKVEAAGASYGQDPKQLVYSGPFVIDQWIKGNKIVLKKNTKYWDASSVKLNTVNMLIVKEISTQMQMFEAKQIDFVIASGEYRDKYTKAATAGQYGMISKVYPGVNYVFFNNKDTNKLFSDQKIRLAFSLAIDREDLVKNVYKSMVPAYGYVPFSVLNGTTEFRKDVPEPLIAVKNQDVKALFKKGLQEAGLDPNGKYTVKLLVVGTNLLNKSAAEYYQNQWLTKLGVNVQIQDVDSNAQMTTTVATGKYSIGMLQWGADYNDPMTFLDMFTTGNPNNLANFGDPAYDKLVSQVASESNYDKRLNIFKQLEEKLVVGDSAIAPVSYVTKALFTQTDLKGMQIPNFGSSLEFKYAYKQGK